MTNCILPGLFCRRFSGPPPPKRSTNRAMVGWHQILYCLAPQYCTACNPSELEYPRAAVIAPNSAVAGIEIVILPQLTIDSNTYRYSKLLPQSGREILFVVCDLTLRYPVLHGSWSQSVSNHGVQSMVLVHVENLSPRVL